MAIARKRGRSSHSLVFQPLHFGTEQALYVVSISPFSVRIEKIDPNKEIVIYAPEVANIFVELVIAWTLLLVEKTKVGGFSKAYPMA